VFNIKEEIQRRRKVVSTPILLSDLTIYMKSAFCENLICMHAEEIAYRSLEFYRSFGALRIFYSGNGRVFLNTIITTLHYNTRLEVELVHGNNKCKTTNQ